jgi:hypothetical protein
VLVTPTVGDREHNGAVERRRDGDAKPTRTANLQIPPRHCYCYLLALLSATWGWGVAVAR